MHCLWFLLPPAPPVFPSLHSLPRQSLIFPYTQPLFSVSPLILSHKSPSLPPSPRSFPLLHWPGRSVSLSSSPPPPPASAYGPSRPGASSRPPLASSAPPPASAAEPAPPSPGSVGRGDGGTDGERREGRDNRESMLMVGKYCDTKWMTIRGGTWELKSQSRVL